jgi:hypothetical protein
VSDPVTVPEWQHRLDRLFPNGAIASWNEDSPQATIYLIPRIYVVEVQGDKPVVWMSAFAGSDKTLGPWLVTNVAPLKASPFAANVTFEGHSRTMRLNGGMDDRLAMVMLSERNPGISRFPDGGMEVFYRNEGADLS